MITLEMLGITPATGRLNHLLNQEVMKYAGYRGIGFDAFCYLDIYDSADMSLRVFIVTEPPDNTGTSITNRAEQVAWTIEKQGLTMGIHNAFEGDEKGRPKNPRCIYIEHYPRSKRRGDFDETFSLATFSISDSAPIYHSANWIHLDRSEVERLIGQEFDRERSYDE